MTCECKKGAVVVYLPRDFEGPITFQYKRVYPRFSEEVQSRLTLFSRDSERGTAFLGDWSKFGDGKRSKDGRYQDWAGDELIVSSKWGAIMVCYADEPREEAGPAPSLLRRLIRGS